MVEKLLTFGEIADSAEVQIRQATQEIFYNLECLKQLEPERVAEVEKYIKNTLNLI